jgi:hypothetical protein
MDRVTPGPGKTVTRNFRRFPGSDWVLVFTLFLILVIFGPVYTAIFGLMSAGALVAWLVVFVAVGSFAAYLWVRPRRQ